MRTMTEAEIKTQADAIARDIMDLLQKRAGKLPSGVALSIPLGVAAALFISCGRTRQGAIAVLNQAFDDLEGE